MVFELQEQIGLLSQSKDNTQSQLDVMQAQIDKLTAILTAEASKGKNE